MGGSSTPGGLCPAAKTTEEAAAAARCQAELVDPSAAAAGAAAAGGAAETLPASGACEPDPPEPPRRSRTGSDPQTCDPSAAETLRVCVALGLIDKPRGAGTDGLRLNMDW